MKKSFAKMHTSILIRTVVICFMIGGLGYQLTDEAAIRFFEAVRLPDFSPGLSGWRLLSVALYFLCGYILYQIMALADPKFPLPFWMLVLVLLAMEGLNYLLIVAHAYELTFWLYLIFTMLVSATWIVLLRFQARLGYWFTGYLLWLVLYQLPWIYRIWEFQH